jgi:hypothetical protein
VAANFLRHTPHGAVFHTQTALARDWLNHLHSIRYRYSHKG